MPDAHGLAIFGADAYAARPAGGPPGPPPPPAAPLRLGPVLIGAAIVYGVYRARRGGRR